jgi:hypothetical protein
LVLNKVTVFIYPHTNPHVTTQKTTADVFIAVRPAGVGVLQYVRFCSIVTELFLLVIPFAQTETPTATR